jgi:hypothetical protein
VRSALPVVEVDQTGLTQVRNVENDPKRAFSRYDLKVRDGGIH